MRQGACALRLSSNVTIFPYIMRIPLLSDYYLICPQFRHVDTDHIVCVCPNRDSVSWLIISLFPSHSRIDNYMRKERNKLNNKRTCAIIKMLQGKENIEA